MTARWLQCPESAACGDGTCTHDEDAASCAVDCGPAAKGCTGAETYVLHDLERRELDVVREIITVSYHASAGELESRRTGGTRDETFSRNVWLAPDTAGDVAFVIVLRDDRGGAGWAALRIRVE